VKAAKAATALDRAIHDVSQSKPTRRLLSRHSPLYGIVFSGYLRVYTRSYTLPPHSRLINETKILRIIVRLWLGI
jgi:hypothetical protein